MTDTSGEKEGGGSKRTGGARHGGAGLFFAFCSQEKLCVVEKLLLATDAKARAKVLLIKIGESVPEHHVPTLALPLWTKNLEMQSYAVP